tara:strand:- start:346 stop:1074 length:729 start_codon:yes stop_codon:yes gene_type:complete
MKYWTYQPKLKHYLNESLRYEIARFPKATQSQKQASSHYDGYNHPKSLNINYPEYQMRRDYATWSDDSAKGGYVDWVKPPIDMSDDQRYKIVFWGDEENGIAPLLKKFARDIAIRPETGLNYKIFVDIMWFHQMDKGDYDNWHNHFACQWIGIYYIDLPEGEQTELMDFEGNVFQPDVKEGDLLIFPSGYVHRSPPCNNRKTIVAFNFSVASNYSRETIERLKETHPQNYFEDTNQIRKFKE